MEHNDHATSARLAGLGRKLAGAGFLVPSIALGATVALSISQYVPATYAAKTTPVSQAGAAELKQVDTSQVEKQSGEPASGVSLNASDYGIDAENLKDSVVMVAHADNPEGAEELKKAIKGKCKEVVMTDIGPVIGTHVGSGMLAVLFLGTRNLKS